jgi:hypothetical protein
MRAIPAKIFFLTLGNGLFLNALSNAQTLRTGDRFPHPVAKTAPVAQNQNSPDWVPIETEGQPMDFKLYDAPNSATDGTTCAGAAFNCEILQTTADNEDTPWGVQRVRPPAFSYFVSSYPTAPGLQQFGGCTFAATPSSMFTVASPFSATRGIVWQGNVTGQAYPSPPGAYSVAVVYSSSNECSDGDQEYGFFTDTTQSADGQAGGQYWIAYYSTATNAPQQQTSTPANSAVIGNLHSHAGGMIYISMYIVPAFDSPTVPASDTGWDFRIQVLNADFSFAQCSVGAGNAALQDCTVDIPISQMAYNDGSPAGQWPVDAHGTVPGQAFVTAGTQTSAWEGIIPAYQCSACANGMWTNGLWLGRESATR